MILFPIVIILTYIFLNLINVWVNLRMEIRLTVVAIMLTSTTMICTLTFSNFGMLMKIISPSIAFVILGIAYYDVKANCITPLQLMVNRLSEIRKVGACELDFTKYNNKKDWVGKFSTELCKLMYRDQFHSDLTVNLLTGKFTTTEDSPDQKEHLTETLFELQGC